MPRFVYMCVATVLQVSLLAMPGPPVYGRIQDGSADVCWSPDSEWPVPCNDED